MLYFAALALIGLASANPPAPKQCNGAVPKCVADGKNCLSIKVGDSSKDVCIKCEPNNVPIDGACKPAADNTNSCVTSDSGAGGVCASCQGSTYLYRGGCYTACPDGFYGKGDNTCASCDGSCDKCEAKTPTSSRCTKCAVTHVPIDGACETIAAAGAKCTAKSAPDGTCQSCGEGRYLYKGGCYTACPDGFYGKGDNTCASCDGSCDKCEAKTPTSSRCTKCAVTHVPIDGACETIAAAGAKCTAKSAPDGTCQSCKGENYLYRGGCYVSCPQGTPNSETNTCDGVPAPDCNLPNCKSCPDGTCTECNDGFALGDDKKCVPSSVNKSGLSTGAIAGIAVAAVIVVGGLVGFLCWWFICRGKA
ncbi:Variant-specific surface protein [Giardia duodenalis]|uniref:Variant-specific surface protein n=1 Tax=Giardia intestinalis TaxID=5741 RepID=V6TGF0_GIAIN|nr:Variant-specific surface protein [Giardia intestinalis]